MGSLSECLWCSRCDLSLGDTAAQVRSVSEPHRCREAGAGGEDWGGWIRSLGVGAGQANFSSVSFRVHWPPTASGLAREKLVIRGTNRLDPVLYKAFLSALGSKGIEPDLQST